MKGGAWIGLHMTAEENALRSDSDSSPDLGDMWEYDNPKILCGAATNRREVRMLLRWSITYEHNVGNLADEVVGQNWSSEVISFFLQDWGVGRVASSCHLSVDFLCHKMRGACKGGSESLRSPRSLCSECPRSSLVELSQQTPCTCSDN